MVVKEAYGGVSILFFALLLFYSTGIALWGHLIPAFLLCRS